MKRQRQQWMGIMSALGLVCEGRSIAIDTVKTPMRLASLHTVRYLGSLR